MILTGHELHKAMNLDLPNERRLITSLAPALTRSARPARLGGRCNQV